MGKKGTPAYKLIDPSMIDAAVGNVVEIIRAREVLCRVAPKCVDLLIAKCEEAEAAIVNYPPDSPEHYKAEEKAVAARKSMNKYADALNAWAEMLNARVEKDTKEGERKCLN